MVDEVTGLSILGSRHKDIKAVDSEYAVIPEMKGTGGTNTGLVAPTQDHVITPVIGDIKPQGIDDESVIEDSPSVLTTIKAAVAPTARDWGNGFYEKYTFERDLDYTEDQAKEDVDEFQRLYGVATAEEVRYMSADTKSAVHMQHKWERVLDKREDTKALIANPITGIVSSVFDLDVVAAFTPVGVVGGVTKAARMGQRAIRGAVGAGVAGGINTVLDEQSLRTDFEQNMDIVSFGLIGALASTSRAIPKAGTTLDNQIDSELRTLSQGEGTPVNVYGTEIRVPTTPTMDDTAFVRSFIDEGVSKMRLNEEITKDNWEAMRDLKDKHSAAHYDKLIHANLTVPDEAVLVGSTKLAHGSKVENLKFTDKWDVADKSYFDNVYGDDVVYLAEGGQSWVAKTQVDAENMRMPYYPHKYEVDVTFEKAYLLTPDTLYPLVSKYSSVHTGDGFVKALKADGYDGIIVRGFDELDYDTLNIHEVLTRIDGNMLQNQVIAFNHKNIKVGSTIDSSVDFVGTSTLKPLNTTTDQMLLGVDDVVSDVVSTQRINPNAPMIGKDLVPDSLKNTKVGAAVDSGIKSTSAYLSSGERMFQYIGYDINHPAARLLASSRTQGDNATYAAATHMANLDHRLMGLGDDIKDVTREVYGTNPILGYAEHTRRMVDVQIDYIRHTQRLDSDVLKFQDFHGRLPTAQELDDFITKSNAPEHIKRLQRTYIKSGFAEEAYDLISHAKLLEDDTMEKITRRSTYTPVRHSYQNMRNLINSGRVKADDLYLYLGRQIQRMYPELLERELKYNLSARQLGKNFYDTKKELDNATAMVSTGGFTKESLTLLMRKSGMNEDTAMKVADNIFRSRDATVSAGGQQGSLRARLNWDWDDTFEGLDGLRYGMADLVDHDIFKTLKDYSRTTSHRIGLAKYGVKSQNDLEKIMQDLVENRPDGVSLQAAKQYAIGVRQQLLGQPIGEALNPVVRSMQSVGGSLVLGGSGLWAVNDLITQTYKVGLLRSLPHIVKSLGAAFKSLKGMSKTDLNDFYEILRGRLGTASGWEHIMTRYDDAFDVSKNIHGTIAHHGQSTRFANGSEFVRRLQVNLLAGIFESAFKGAAKGSARDIQYLKKNFKFSDDLIKGVSTEYSKHKGYIDGWNQDVRLDVMQKIQYEADNLAHVIRAGEAPAFMEHNTIGKVMFPFLQYAFAMQEKMLRNTFHRDGGTAVAMIAAVQFPTAAMLGAVNNVKNGKEWDDNLAASAANSFSIIGAFGIPMSMILSGYGAGSSSAMIPVDTAMKLGAKIFNEDSEVTGRDILRATPLNTFLPFPLILSAFEDD